MSFWNRTFANIKAFPGGVKKVFIESKTAIKFHYNSGGVLKRRESEFVRKNQESLKKLCGFLIVQAVPIIGYIPLFFAFQYPKQILTHHFWSEEQTIAFMTENFTQKFKQSVTLLKSLGVEAHSVVSSDQFLKSCSEELVNQPQSVDNLSVEEVDSFIVANSLCDSSFALKCTHNYFLRRRLKQHVHQIVKDDKLIIEEGGLPTLTTEEVKETAVRRGVNPNLSTEDTARYLTEWLDARNMTHIRSDFVNKAVPSAKDHNAMVLLYAMAFNSTRTYKHVPAIEVDFTRPHVL